MPKEIIAIGSDHAGFALKQALTAELPSRGFDVKDVGTFSTDSVDYPDFVLPVARAVNSGEIKRGIVICGSAQGAAMTANKLPKVRAAICRNVSDAELARKHNDANILALGERVTPLSDALAILDVFLKTEFEGGRHATRVQKMQQAC